MQSLDLSSLSEDSKIREILEELAELIQENKNMKLTLDLWKKQLAIFAMNYPDAEMYYPELGKIDWDKLCISVRMDRASVGVRLGELNMPVKSWDMMPKVK